MLSAPDLRWFGSAVPLIAMGKKTEKQPVHVSPESSTDPIARSISVVMVIARCISVVVVITRTGVFVSRW